MLRKMQRDLRRYDDDGFLLLLQRLRVDEQRGHRQLGKVRTPAPLSERKNVATSRRRYCTSLDGESTYAKCVNNCQTASANVQHVGECEYGCEYWALLPEEEPEETVTKTKASYVSKSSWNEVAFIAVLGCIIVLLLGYRRRRMRLRSGASQPYVPIKTVYNNGTEVL